MLVGKLQINDYSQKLWAVLFQTTNTFRNIQAGSQIVWKHKKGQTLPFSYLLYIIHTALITVHCLHKPASDEIQNWDGGESSCSVIMKTHSWSFFCPFISIKQKQRMNFSSQGFGVASFQRYRDIFTVVLQGDQKHLLAFKEKHKIPIMPFFFILYPWEQTQLATDTGRCKNK